MGSVLSHFRDYFRDYRQFTHFTKKYHKVNTDVSICFAEPKQ